MAGKLAARMLGAVLGVLFAGSLSAQIVIGPAADLRVFPIAPGAVACLLCLESDGTGFPLTANTTLTGAGIEATFGGPLRFGTLGVYYGTGSPEAAVTAAVGSMYLNLSGGAGTSLYVKETGAGNTGWVTPGGDTLPIVDTTAVVKGSVDATKLVRIEADGLTTGTTRVITMPDADVDLGALASTALDNLASVAINTALLPDAAAADDFGSATLPFKDLFFAGSSGTPGTNNFRITGASTSGTRVITAPDGSTTLPVFTQPITFAGPTAARTVTLFDGNHTVMALGQLNEAVAERTRITSTSASQALYVANNGTGTGVFGQASSLYGLYGLATTGRGVFGTASTGYGGYFETTGPSANPVIYALKSATHTGPGLTVNATTGATGSLINAQSNGVDVFRIGADGGLSTGPGTTLTATATAPAATTGASQAGVPVTITASPAVASTDTAGAAAGGDVTITAGAAARNTSGNAKGGNITLMPGDPIGTDSMGSVWIRKPAAPSSSQALVAALKIRAPVNEDGHLIAFYGANETTPIGFIGTRTGNSTVSMQLARISLTGQLEGPGYGTAGAGSYLVSTRLGMGSGFNLAWTANNPWETADTGLARNAAGVVRVTNGSTGTGGLVSTGIDRPEPTATTGASQVGLPIAITASDAVASTDTAGAAAGGSVMFQAGIAARNTSGNADAGHYEFGVAAGIGTGVGAQILQYNQGTVARPSYGWDVSGNRGYGMYYSGGVIGFSSNGISRLRVTNGGVNVDGGITGHATKASGGSIGGFKRLVFNNTNDTVTSGSYLFPTVNTNGSLAAARTYTLPSAVIGDTYTFVDDNATYRMTFKPNTGDNIIWKDGTSVSATGSIVTTARYQSVTFFAPNVDTWVVLEVQDLGTVMTVTP